jgi:hypothetical protein
MPKSILFFVLILISQIGCVKESGQIGWVADVSSPLSGENCAWVTAVEIQQKNFFVLPISEKKTSVSNQLFYCCAPASGEAPVCDKVNWSQTPGFAKNKRPKQRRGSSLIAAAKTKAQATVDMARDGMAERSTEGSKESATGQQDTQNPVSEMLRAQPQEAALIEFPNYVAVHLADVFTKKNPEPKFPKTMLGIPLSASDKKCIVRVFIDETGRPEDVLMSSCHEGLQEETREAVMRARWYPVKVENEKVKAQFPLVIKY